MDRRFTALITRKNSNINKHCLLSHDIKVISEIKDLCSCRFDTIIITNDAKSNKDLDQIIAIIVANNEKIITKVEL